MVDRGHIGQGLRRYLEDLGRRGVRRLQNVRCDGGVSGRELSLFRESTREWGICTATV